MDHRRAQGLLSKAALRCGTRENNLDPQMDTERTPAMPPQVLMLRHWCEKPRGGTCSV